MKFLKLKKMTYVIFQDYRQIFLIIHFIKQPNNYLIKKILILIKPIYSNTILK